MKRIGLITLAVGLAVSMWAKDGETPGQAAPVAMTETRAQRDARMQWWRDARFGMFIHWGVYAVLGGVYQGQIVDPKHGAEWIQCDALIPRADYEPFTKQFNPTNFDADAWVSVAQAAGMKYIVITSKHHDGFSLFGTKVGDYNIVQATPFKRDPLKELSLACKKAGMHFGVYYSQLDWHHPAQENDPAKEGRQAYRFNRMRDGMKDRYVADMKAQLKELIQDYGVEVIFFDGEWVPWWTQEDGLDLLQYVRGLNPQLIVNNRVGKRKKADGDYGTPEQEIPSAGLDYDWESCMTLNGTWGYKSYDHEWKTCADLIFKLADIASKGGNFLLNVGPDALGVIPATSVQRLREMGEWLRVNGEAVYGTRLWNPNAKCDPSAEAEAFGPGPEEKVPVETASSKDVSPETKNIRYTLKGDTLYAVLFAWPSDGKIIFKALASGRTAREIRTVELLGSATKLEWSRNAEGLTVRLPPQKPNAAAAVFKIASAAK